jgi:SAM-dependent methyltransferase
MIGPRALLAAWRAVDVRTFALRRARCPFCGPTIIVRLRAEETAIRCLRCGASAVHLSIGWALRAAFADWRPVDVFELSSSGALVDWLRGQCESLVLSELFDDVAPGSMRGDVRCEEVQALTFAPESFDLVTHTEVLEHVPDDGAGLRELHRVLRPGGRMLFTVPLHFDAATRERAVLRAGKIESLLPPMFHGDRLRGPGQVLCYRDYGPDIVARVAAAGFAQVELLPPDARVPWSFGRHVISARKLVVHPGAASA